MRQAGSEATTREARRSLPLKGGELERGSREALKRPRIQIALPFQGMPRPLLWILSSPKLRRGHFCSRIGRTRDGSDTRGPPQNTWMNLLITSTFSGSVPVVTEKSMNF